MLSHALTLSLMNMDDDLDNLDNVRAATMKLQEFIDKLDSYRGMGRLTSEQAAALIVDQQAAADTCVAAFQATVRRRMKSSPNA